MDARNKKLTREFSETIAEIRKRKEMGKVVPALVVGPDGVLIHNKDLDFETLCRK